MHNCTANNLICEWMNWGVIRMVLKQSGETNEKKSYQEISEVI